MPEVTIKYKSDQALKALYDIAKVFDMTIEKSAKRKSPKSANQQKELPITFAENPDVTALAGIWDGRDITLEEIRKEAWGERV